VKTNEQKEEEMEVNFWQVQCAFKQWLKKNFVSFEIPTLLSATSGPHKQSIGCLRQLVYEGIFAYLLWLHTCSPVHYSNAWWRI